MEPHSIYLTLLLLLLSSITITLFTIFYKHKSHYNHPNLPPGSPGPPFVGETLNFLSDGWNGHPEKFVLDRVAKFRSSIFKTHLINHPAAVLSGSAGNKFLFSNENKLVRLWWPDSINKIFPPTKEEDQTVKLLLQFLGPEALQRYVGTMDEIAHQHFESGWKNRQIVSVFPLAKEFTFWVACKVFFGLEDHERIERFLKPFDEVASGIVALPFDLPGTGFRRAVKSAKFIREEYLMDIIRARKAELAVPDLRGDEKTKDILSVMLTATDDNGKHMSEIAVATKILGLLVAGHDTASSTCTFVVKYLAELPHIYDRVYQEQIEIARSKVKGETLTWQDLQKMKYTWNVAREVMRLIPPAQGGFREVIKDFNFSGFSIPKGWKLYWSGPATHKNEEYFPEPEKFDPSRFEGRGPLPYTFVPFGGGPRMCPGKEYARVEILVFIHNLVKRFKFEKLLPNEKIRAIPFAVPANGLPVRLYPH